MVASLTLPLRIREQGLAQKAGQPIMGSFQKHPNCPDLCKRPKSFWKAWSISFDLCMGICSTRVTNKLLGTQKYLFFPRAKAHKSKMPWPIYFETCMKAAPDCDGLFLLKPAWRAVRKDGQLVLVQILKYISCSDRATGPNRPGEHGHLLCCVEKCSKRMAN